MKEALLINSLKKELSSFEKKESTFYISKSIIFQNNMNELRRELEKMERIFVQEVRESELINERLKHVILERVSEHVLEK